jgi:hypothetical protein
MRVHRFLSAVDSRFWWVAALLGLFLMLVMAGRANAAPIISDEAQAPVGAITQEIVVEEHTMIVDLASTADSSAVYTAGSEAFEFMEQNVFLGTTNASVSTTREQFHYLQDNLDIPAASSAVGTREQFHYLQDNLDIASARSVGGTRERYHYLEDNLDISGQITPGVTERYDRRQFLSNDNGDGSVAASPQAEVEENVDGTLSAGFASGRYDQIRGSTDEGIETSGATSPTRGLRYDERQFLEDNVTSMSGVAGESKTSVRIHHDDYPQPKSARTKEWAQAERDRIQFLEDNWLYPEPASNLPPLVNEHLAQ